MIKAVFFDLDDTLIDSFKYHRKASREAFTSIGVDYNKISNIARKNYNFMGMRVIEILIILKNIAGISEKEFPLSKLSKIREEIFLEYVKNDVELLPGAEKALKLSKKNFEITGIVSSGTTKYINLFLKRFNLKDYIDIVVSGNDIKKGKPSPDCYLKAYQLLPHKLKIKKSECLVVEDALNGIKAAQAAKLKTLLIPYKNSKEKVNSDWRMNSLNNFNSKYINTIKKPGIKAIIFDFGNVLYKWDNALFAKTMKLYSNKSIPYITKLLSKPSYLPVRHETGKISPETFCIKVSKKCNMKISKKEFKNAFVNIFTPIHATLKLIPELKKNYQLALLTDTNFWHHQEYMKKTPFYKYFNTISLSYKLGVLKPNKKIYIDTLKKLGLKPEECVFIDDVKKNTLGAKKLGIHTIHYTTHKKLIDSLKKLDIKY